MVSTLEQMQVPNGTGPGVRRSKRPLFAHEEVVILIEEWKVLLWRMLKDTPDFDRMTFEKYHDRRSLDNHQI